jgi:toxin ParE1/3/4
MSALRLVRTSAAERDLYSIWHYIAKDDIVAADRLIRRIDERFRELTKQPGLGEAIPISQVGLRRTRVDSYLIFYQVADDSVRIARVLHGARKWEDLI